MFLSSSVPSTALYSKKDTFHYSTSTHTHFLLFIPFPITLTPVFAFFSKNDSSLSLPISPLLYPPFLTLIQRHIPPISLPLPLYFAVYLKLKRRGGKGYRDFDFEKKNYYRRSISFKYLQKNQNSRIHVLMIYTIKMENEQL